jgi:hypothetical protein
MSALNEKMHKWDAPDFFTLQFIQKAVQRAELRLLVYKENPEVITQWIP